jgi:arylsulfatase A-like enzyme
MKYLSPLLASVLLQPLAGFSAGTPVPEPEKPNVLMIIVDDMNDWVGALNGHPDVRTPNIDRLARRGMLFTNAHVVAPVCNPSRVATLTGKLPSTTGIYDNSVHWHEALPGVTTIPQHFKENGYRVFGGGKVHHHTPGNNRRSDWHEFFDQVFDSHAQQHLLKEGSFRDFAWPEGFPLSGIPEVVALSRPPKNPREFDWGAFDRDDLEMGDGRMVKWAETILKEPPEDPFFLAAGIYMPHLPWYAPRNYFDLYPVDSVTPPPVKGDDLDDIPEGGQEMAADRREDLELVRKHGKYNEVLQAYLAAITYADSLVGRLLDALEAGGSSDNTIIVFWSDHGWHFGEKNHLHKFTLWERSTRIPFVVSVPGVTAPGSRTGQPASMVDIFPTLLDLCGLPEVHGLDGSSLVPQLRHEQVRERPALTTHKRGNHAVRSEHWRYIRYADGGEELYDHRSDPHEWTNLAGVPEFQSVKAELGKWLPLHDAPTITKRTIRDRNQ